MLTIAVDAMGGDNAPKAEVEGAIRAASELDLRVILVGQEDVVRQELAKHARAHSLPIEIRHAAEAITTSALILSFEKIRSRPVWTLVAAI